MPKPPERSRPRRTPAFCIFTGLFLLPFIYLASLALLLSAYVHGWGMPSREFLRVYSIPSNVITTTPAVGSVYSNYFRFCVRATKADYESEQNK
ncbi:MAG TPA: hypothetical protein VFZ59_09385 [Verrucomicrobiae bacterium]|nr:hypothetical protein [Verrucomicrobiae bacterium]